MLCVRGWLANLSGRPCPPLTRARLEARLRQLLRCLGIRRHLVGLETGAGNGHFDVFQTALHRVVRDGDLVRPNVRIHVRYRHSLNPIDGTDDDFGARHVLHLGHGNDDSRYVLLATAAQQRPGSETECKNQISHEAKG